MNLTVFFYSKYDSYSLDILNRFDIDTMNVLCVDNVKIRDKIINDTRWNIKQVPCILKITEEGFSVIEEPLLSRLVEEQQETQTNEMMSLPTEEEEMETTITEEMDTIKEEEEEVEQDNKTSQPSLSISNIVQKMQKEREEGEKLMKTLYD